MTREELDKYARTQAEDAVRYHKSPIEEFTIQNIAEHIRDAWLDGAQSVRISES
jgi:hypothetical protein